MSRRRGLSPEDHALWSQVTRSATPLNPQRKSKDGAAGQAAKPKPGAPVTRSQPDPYPAIPAFRLGQNATATSTRLPVALEASPAQRLAANPVRMDHKTHRRMVQGKLRPEARLDLHGMTLAAAHPELMHFILSCRTQGHRLVLVITGKGRGDHGPLPTRPGALRHQVPLWLHQAPLAAAVQQVTAAHDRHGGEGAYYVYLRRMA